MGGQLTALQISKIKNRGRYGDGDGLWLQVTATGTRSWLFRFMRNGRAREMGLGSIKAVSLAQARALAAVCRNDLANGHDPIDQRKGARAERRAEASRSISFRQAAEQYVASHKAAWKNEKHIEQWSNTLESYAYPVIGELLVCDVSTPHVVKIIEELWQEKTVTASRLRGRIERILDWAKVREYRSGENPARWRGHLDQVLPAPSKIIRVRHHPAMPFSDVPTFMQELRAIEGITERALEFLILTAARTSEVVEATVDEFDLHNAVWSVPAARMKGKRLHRVPLPPRALYIARQSFPERGYAFPGRFNGRTLSENTMLELLERMNRGAFTTHGFRSSFHDWASEITNFDNNAVEMALAHSIKNKTEAAYRRGDLFEKRKLLMRDWSAFCEGKQSIGVVLPFAKAADV